MKQKIKRFLNKIIQNIPFFNFFNREETIEQWARKNGYKKKIEKLYNPSNVSQEDEDWDYLQDLHYYDDK